MKIVVLIGCIVGALSAVLFPYLFWEQIVAHTLPFPFLVMEVIVFLLPILLCCLGVFVYCNLKPVSNEHLSQVNYWLIECPEYKSKIKNSRNMSLCDFYRLKRAFPKFKDKLESRRLMIGYISKFNDTYPCRIELNKPLSRWSVKDLKSTVNKISAMLEKERLERAVEEIESY